MPMVNGQGTGPRQLKLLLAHERSRVKPFEQGGGRSE